MHIKRSYDEASILFACFTQDREASVVMVKRSYYEASILFACFTQDREASVVMVSMLVYILLLCGIYHMINM